MKLVADLRPVSDREGGAFCAAHVLRSGLGPLLLLYFAVPTTRHPWLGTAVLCWGEHATRVTDGVAGVLCGAK